MRVWLMGFWDGLNARDGDEKGRETDFDGISAEVQLRCNRAAATLIAAAVLEVWRTMR
jgi:hypothetical protein